MTPCRVTPASAAARCATVFVLTIARAGFTQDPAGAARSVTEIEGEEPDPAAHVVGRRGDRGTGRAPYPWERTDDED